MPYLQKIDVRTFFNDRELIKGYFISTLESFAPGIQTHTQEMAQIQKRSHKIR